MHQSMALAREPATYLSRFLAQTTGGRANAAARLRLSKAAIAQACRSEKPSLGPDHLRTLVTDPTTRRVDYPALLNLLTDRAERLSPPRVEVDFSIPDRLSARVALACATHYNDEPALRAALAAILST